MYDPEKLDDVVTYISDYIDENGYSPSFRDILEGVGFQSTDTVRRYLTMLRDQGRVTWLNKSSRTVRITGR